MSKARLLLWEQWVDDWFSTSVDESLEDIQGDAQQRYETIALWVPSGFSGLGIATISALLQIFGILSWRMQEVRNSQNQDLRADLAWSINSRKMESNPGHFSGFRRLRAASSSDTVTLRCWNLPQVGQLLVDEPGGLAAASPVCPVLHEL